MATKGKSVGGMGRGVDERNERVIRGRGGGEALSHDEFCML